MRFDEGYIMTALLIVEHDNHVMSASTTKVLSAALDLGKSPVLLVVGSQCEQVAMEAACLAGVEKVILADNPCYAHQLPENVSQLIVSIAKSFSAILIGASTFGKNLLPRVAALLDVAQVSDVCKIINEDTFEHPIYAGNAIETIRILSPIKLLTIRPSAFLAVLSRQNPCPIEKLDTIIEERNTHFIQHELSQSIRPDLNAAKIVVSGGRGLQSAEKFQLIETLADALGAAVGASRAAVDAGFVPNEYQVGQTGRIVAPEIYIAIGISGAVQHLAGMKDSKTIVAINKDEDAPIFQIADYGLVGDLFELVPQLIQELEARKRK